MPGGGQWPRSPRLEAGSCWPHRAQGLRVGSGVPFTQGGGARPGARCPLSHRAAGGAGAWWGRCCAPAGAGNWPRVGASPSGGLWEGLSLSWGEQGASRWSPGRCRADQRLCFVGSEEPGQGHRIWWWRCAHVLLCWPPHQSHAEGFIPVTCGDSEVRRCSTASLQFLTAHLASSSSAHTTVPSCALQRSPTRLCYTPASPSGSLLF